MSPWKRAFEKYIAPGLIFGILWYQKYKVNIISTLDFVLGQHAAKFVGMCNDEESKKWQLSLATLSLIDTPDQY